MGYQWEEDYEPVGDMIMFFVGIGMGFVICFIILLIYFKAAENKKEMEHVLVSAYVLNGKVILETPPYVYSSFTLCNYEGKKGGQPYTCVSNTKKRLRME